MSRQIALIVMFDSADSEPDLVGREPACGVRSSLSTKPILLDDQQFAEIFQNSNEQTDGSEKNQA